MAVRRLAVTRKGYVFGLIWFGQLISIIGSGLSGFALGVWIYQRTTMATHMSLVYFFSALSSITLAPLAGVLADRWNRRWIMILSDTGAAVRTLVVLLLLAAGRLEPWHIYPLTALGSACNAFQSPAYTASTTMLVPKKHLGRASGMIQLGPAVTQIIAPLLGGVMVMVIGLKGVLLIDLATFFFAVFTLLIIRIPQPEPAVTGQEEGKRDSRWRDVVYGWTYIKERPGLRHLLLFYALTNFTGYMVIVLINPLVLSFSDASVLGVVASVAGCGMLLGALAASVWGGPKRRINGLLGFALLRGALFLLGGMQPSASLIATAAFVFLCMGQISGACSRAIWLSKVAPDVQGRVFSLTYMVAGSTVPLAFLAAGPLADNVFQPLLDADGPLAGSVGQIIGTGPGRGIGLLFVLLGIINMLVTVGAYLNPRIRLVEDELPDAIGDDAPATVEKSSRSKKEVRVKMKRIRKWLVRIGIALLLIVIVLGGVGVWFVRRPWPQVSGTVAVPGLLAPVEVIRDQGGVPHIYAQNEHDLFFVQGYVHAQDRLWQMEANRRLCSGTLSEVVGSPLVGWDLYFRTLGLRRGAEQSWAELDGDSRTILEAYAKGVNAYIETHHNRLPLEFTILGVDPEPWTPVDSMAWGSMMAFYMSINHRSELLQAQVIAELGEEAAKQLLSPPVEDMPAIVPAEAGNYDWLRDARFEELAVVDEWLGNPDGSWGSNNWVVHGSRTVTGMPILANDTHMGLPMPSYWYGNGLHGGRFDSVGFTFPGVPLVVVGHNQRIAWGITNLDPDVQDIYLERLDDLEDPTQYEFMGEWYDLEIVQEPVQVKGRSEPIPWVVFLTRHGPIINYVFPDLPEDAPPMSLRWTLYEGSEVFKSIALINLAANWDEFRASLRYWDIISQNFVYADVEGNIGYQAAGEIPIRLPEHQGMLPVPGWTGEYEWQGFVPFDELPWAFNPPAGFIATANNRVVSDDYPYQLCNEWFPGYRARRITDLLTASERFTVEDMQDIQAQTYSLPAEALCPYLLAVEPENDIQAEALAHVEAWDLYCETDRVGASIYETWYMFLLQNVVGDELGEELTGQYQRNTRKHMPTIIEFMAEADNAWFDDVNTPEVETRDDIVRRSLADAVAWLSERYGRNTDRWQWGRLHTMTFIHTPLGQSGVAPLERIFNGRTIPAPGSQFTVNMTRYTWPDQPFSVVHGTSQRMIVDVSDLDNMLVVNSTGQSEHIFHLHRDDLISMWQNVEYHLLLFTGEAVEENAEAVLTLTPQ